MPTNAHPQIECPQCGEHAVTFRTEAQNFNYGADDDLCELTADVPVGRCAVCGCSFTDDRAESIRHEAICRHLGIHSPSEIVALRKKLNLSRAALADITKIGEASIARWERGASFQNAAMDQLLYLVSLNGNLNKLRARNSYSQAPEQVVEQTLLSAVMYTFPNISDLPAAKKEAQYFYLRASVG